MKQYDHKKIEKKWQMEWAKRKIYATKDDSKKPKFYALDMFPYPSGEGLHVGHPKGYIATDIISRMKRMQGHNVLHPMGFDAFGLPAENYAITTRTNPQISVAKNVARYKKQLEILGFDYDWSREINTTDPRYYKWTQWIFLKLLERGLAYESYEPINWCPSCKTGLANEDVEDGRCERCGTPVEKRPMRQWVLRITDYADRLLKDLDTLDWPEHIKESQKNWIGRSDGAEIDFALKGRQEKIKVFTTRPDTLFGVTYVVLSPEHPWINELLSHVENEKEVVKYVADARIKTEIERTDAKKEKTGIEVKGIKAINPANGEEVPMWIADYVLADYGTGAIMAVPAHDEKDFEFAKKYKLPIRYVVEPKFVADPTREGAIQPELPFVKREAVCVIVRNPKDDTYLCISWKGMLMHGLVTGGIEDGEDIVETARRELKEETGYKNLKYIKTSPIAINTFFYHRVKKQNRHAHFQFVFFDLENEEKDSVDEKEASLHEIVWEKKSELKDFFTVFEGRFLVELLKKDKFAFVGDGILTDSENFSGKNSEEVKKEITDSVGGKWVTKYKLKDWVFSRQRYWGEPIPVFHDGNKIIPVAEKDLPVVLPKVKYYEPTGTGESPLAGIPKWVNVKVGKGNDAKILKRETNTMPQWAGSSWYYLRYMDPKDGKMLVDPKKEKYWNEVDFYVGGAEHATRHLIYARFWHKFLYDIGVVSTIEPFRKLQSVGLIMGEDGRKMSKRFGNVVNPDDIVSTYGADTLRVYEMFMGPFDQAIAWSTDSMIGSRRFVERVWKLQERVSEKAVSGSLVRKASTTRSSDTAFSALLHKTIKKVTEDIGAMRFNTAISSLMILMNAFDKEEKISRSDFEIFLKLLAPFAPHISEEIWQSLGNKKSIHISDWPTWDENLIKDAKVKIAVQINGKVRAVIEIAADADESVAKAVALATPEIQKWLSGKTPSKTIYVKGRVINFIILG